MFIVSSVQKIIDSQQDFVFTDGHAADKLSKIYLRESLDDIDRLLDWDAISAKYWRDEADLDKKRKKEAEFLLLGDLPTTAIVGFAVANKTAEEQMLRFGAKPNMVGIRPQFYF
jgi:hypothetical protein